MNAVADPRLALMELALDCEYDPLAFARAFWPWGMEGFSPAIRTWQAEVLGYIGERLQNPATRCEPIKIAISSGNGVGKSALIAMVLGWGMGSHPRCKAVITAGKGEQLDGKTVPEVAKWLKSSLCADWFDVRAQSIRSTQTPDSESWRTDFVTWTAENPETFQGLHNLGRIIIFGFDEGSIIPQVIYDAAEGSLTDENTILIWLVFGNPTRNTGPFRECFGSQKHRWKTWQIDSRTVEGVSHAQAEKWIADYGEDSDFVRVRVRGEFPRAGSSQFIPGDIVSAARRYIATGFAGLPKILSVDVARFGDDQTVIGTRQGRKAEILIKLRGQDTVQAAERVIAFINTENPDAIIVDGDGIGAGVVDQLKYRGFEDKLFEFHGGATPSDPAQYFNKRAEVWGLMRAWLVEGAQIPDDPELGADLTGPEYGFSAKQQIQLEKKENMKERGLASPDCGDMLAMTFAVTIAPPKPKPSGPPPRVGVWS